MFTMRQHLTLRQRELVRFLGERAEKGEPPPTYREICREFGYKSPKAASDHIAALQRKGLVTRETRCARSIRLVHGAMGIPLLGHIAAGIPQDALTESDERLNVDPKFCGILDRSRAFALRVQGDSMIGRQILEGDIVVLEHAAVPHHGDVVAALIDNKSTLKTFVRKRGKVWLQAESPLYRDLVPVIELQVQGVARAVIRLL
jgi:repressor LexA